MMTKGRIGDSPIRNLRIILTIQVIWLGIVCILAAWWGFLVLKSAGRVLELEQKVGISITTSQLNWQKTHRMLFWESLFFFGLLILSSIFYFWVYYRDLKRSKSVQAFFAAFTHELRTPLTSIRLQAESIAEDFEKDPSKKAAQTVVQRLLEDTQRLESQVERTLELSRIEGGGPLYLVPFEIKSAIERAVREHKETFQNKIQVDLQLQTAEVMGDPHAFHIVIKNLIENSIRHASQEKDVVHIQIRTELKSGTVLLSYRDNGGGFKGPTHILGNLFEKGNQSKGTGVGLYLVKALISKMKGKVEFSSEAGFPVLIQLKVAMHG